MDGRFPQELRREPGTRGPRARSWSVPRWYHGAFARQPPGHPTIAKEDAGSLGGAVLGPAPPLGGLRPRPGRTAACCPSSRVFLRDRAFVHQGFRQEAGGFTTKDLEESSPVHTVTRSRPTANSPWSRGSWVRSGAFSGGADIYLGSGGASSP